MTDGEGVHSSWKGVQFVVARVSIRRGEGFNSSLQASVGGGGGGACRVRQRESTVRGRCPAWPMGIAFANKGERRRSVTTTRSAVTWCGGRACGGGNLAARTEHAQRNYGHSHGWPLDHQQNSK